MSALKSLMNPRFNDDDYAHKMVRDLQISMAHMIYDYLATEDPDCDLFYKLEPDETAYVNRVAPTLRREAVRILAELLGRHDTPQEDKDEIYEAILLDRTLPDEAVWHENYSPFAAIRKPN